MRITKIPVALRFDDPSETSNLEIEKSVISSLNRHGITATLAVIPYREIQGKIEPFSVARANHLAQAQQQGIIEIAQHGFCHKDLTKMALGISSEFLSSSIEEQSNAIRQGLSHLQSLFCTSIEGFVPPFNTYDSKTVAALSELKFKYVSGSLEAHQCDQSLQTLPGTCLLPSLLTNIESARKNRKYDVTIIAVMHHFDFFESGADRAWLSLDDFDQLIKDLAAQTDVTIFTLGKLVEHLGPTKLQTGLNNYHLSKKLHWRLRKRLPTGCLVMNPWWQAARCLLYR